MQTVVAGLNLTQLLRRTSEVTITAQVLAARTQSLRVLEGGFNTQVVSEDA
jgi:hypothetical protein